MTAIPAATTFDIPLETAEEANLADLIFKKKPKLFAAMQSKLGIDLRLTEEDGNLMSISVAVKPPSKHQMKKAFSSAALPRPANQNDVMNAFTNLLQIYKQVGKKIDIAHVDNACKSFTSAAATQATTEGTFDEYLGDRTTEKQKQLYKTIMEKGYTFGTGPAGTGKTYIGAKAAVKLLKARKINKIIITRPAVGVDEDLGFLPGTYLDKIKPFIQPVLDELDKAFGKDAWKDMIETEQLVVAPLSYMRGRTFDDAFIMIDEAQNATINQTKMYLTRMGRNSMMFINGDPDQCDLPKKVKSGLMWAHGRIKDSPSVGSIEFTEEDSVRSEHVKAILPLLKEDEEKQVVKPKPDRTTRPGAHS